MSDRNNKHLLAMRNNYGNLGDSTTYSTHTKPHHAPSIQRRVSTYGSTVPSLDPGRFFSFLILHTVGTTPWTGDQPVARPLPAHRTAETQNKHTQTSMPQVGSKPTIPAFERVKTVHASDSAATVTAIRHYGHHKNGGKRNISIPYLFHR
jgi:hypothetical protein